jgi:hypothetical protein
VAAELPGWFKPRASSPLVPSDGGYRRVVLAALGEGMERIEGVRRLFPGAAFRDGAFALRKKGQ